jgi:hypothetical protein
MQHIQDANIHILKFTDDITEEVYEQYTTQFYALLNGKKKVSIIFDMLEIEAIPMKYIWKQAAIMKEIERLSDAWLLCSCIITDSQLVRKALKVLFNIREPKRPLAITNSKQKALDFCDQHNTS